MERWRRILYLVQSNYAETVCVTLFYAHALWTRQVWGTCNGRPLVYSASNLERFRTDTFPRSYLAGLARKIPPIWSPMKSQTAATTLVGAHTSYHQRLW